MENVNKCNLIIFKEQIKLKMGPGTQLTVLMGVNHSKLFIR